MVSACAEHPHSREASMSDDLDEYLVERLTTDAGTEDGALQFDENALPRSGRSSAWGDGQITPEMIQAGDQEIKTRFPVFYDTTDLSARHDLIRAIFLTMLAVD